MDYYTKKEIIKRCAALAFIGVLQASSETITAKMVYHNAAAGSLFFMLLLPGLVMVSGVAGAGLYAGRALERIREKSPAETTPAAGRIHMLHNGICAALLYVYFDWHMQWGDPDPLWPMACATDLLCFFLAVGVTVCVTALWMWVRRRRKKE